MTRPKPRPILGRISSHLEASEQIDTLAAPLHRLVGRLARPGSLRDALSGTALGHPVHPALVTGPLGCWTASLVADVVGDRRTAQALIGTGLLLAAPAATAGASDWVDTTGAERRIGFIHLAANTAAIGCYAASWRARHRDDHSRGIAYALVGATALTVGAWLGGHLAYAMGVGVDTTAFDGGPSEWTRVTRSHDNPAAGQAAGIPLLIAEQPDGHRVLAGRCTHRGGPLAEGRIKDGCVICPWHGSQFSLDDGTVQAGPAVAPQPVYDTRVDPDGLFVRREEVRSLRVNPVRGTR
jgi:nitrite reductase/ring-hydroxylating ferredoxin subunit/uncharacterized membrane protein